MIRKQIKSASLNPNSDNFQKPTKLLAIPIHLPNVYVQKMPENVMRMEWVSSPPFFARHPLLHFHLRRRSYELESAGLYELIRLIFRYRCSIE